MARPAAAKIWKPLAVTAMAVRTCGWRHPPIAAVSNEVKSRDSESRAYWAGATSIAFTIAVTHKPALWMAIFASAPREAALSSRFTGRPLANLSRSFSKCPCCPPDHLPT